MPTTTIAGRTIHIDADGYLTDFGEWNERLADDLARLIGITLTDRHIAVLRFMRHDYVHLGDTPALRRIWTVGGFPIGELLTLFPGRPVRKMAYLAGLPRPRGCV
jgi:tRNA 2-thiouridine synthesizing protein E